MLVLWCHRNRTPVCIMSGDLMPIVHAVNEGFLDSPVADRNHSHRYEELMGESVSCPTCRGLGRVPREQDSLVALIPVNDKRLKPRRTCLWVAIAVFLTLLAGALTAFFLVPREVKLLSNNPNIHPYSVNISKNGNKSFVVMKFVNVYNCSNQNFYPISIKKLELTSYMFDSESTIVAHAYNRSELTVPMKSTKECSINVTMTFKHQFGYMATYCCDPRDWVHTFIMRFQSVITASYLGHTEEMSLVTYQNVDCYLESSKKQCAEFI
ncbi:transmembrane protein 106B isoform X4 [Lingula anatina]|uniref:Transmembrane protein 106B isoform X4 n=1 Tax=Lingula anatina TaxID=7574 RepID=A0A1S3JIG6_LINAN|nr:transmembrane protein 106B isoform X4 [Lingula anatina]|eukprot:XP_013409694.1 transmembrane protein 106B isoform X4 [Lingula anatina]